MFGRMGKARLLAARWRARRMGSGWLLVLGTMALATAGPSWAQTVYNPPAPGPRRSAADGTRALFALPGVDATTAAQAAASYAGPDLRGTDGPLGKLDPNLVLLFHENATGRLSGASARSAVELATIDGGTVVVDAFAATPEDAKVLLGELQALGLVRGAQAGRVVSGFMPISALDDAAALADLHSMALSVMAPNVGDTTSQGDQAMLTDDARTIQGIDGTGVKVGVISDSHDHLGGDLAGFLSGDLPNVQVVLDSNLPTDTDEGRAMCEIVHDVAPGAAIAFHTANGGQANMVGAINALIGANCHIIVDDIRYLTEPMYQDGIIAQAASNVFVGGRLHFSAAGNQAARSYENGFNGNVSNFVGLLGGRLHAWDGNDDVYWQFNLPDTARLQLAFQWNDPHFAVSGAPGAQTEMGIAIVNNVPAILASSNIANVGGNPVEVVSYTNTTGAAQTVWVTVEHMAGPFPVRMKWVRFSSGPAPTFNEYSAVENKATVFGTPNGTNTVAVGAAFYGQTPDFGTNPPVAEAFTSLGGTPIRYNLAGAAIPEVVRNKPELSAPDGGNTTFFGNDIGGDADAFPNFFGTSAAAPHAAAFAALVYHFHGGVTKKTNAQVRDIMIASCVDMNTAGFDFLTGAGLIQGLPDALDDKDGVNGTIENEVPSWPFSEYQPKLDGNGDNLPDRAQPHVTSFPNAEDGRYITLIVAPNIQIDTVDAGSQANLPGVPPAGYTWPVGAYGYRLSGPGVTPGGITQVNVLYETAPNPLPTSYHKFDLTPQFNYTQLPSGGPGQPGAVYDGNRQVILYLQDAVGAANIYDFNGAAGVIYDPGGPTVGPVLAVDLASFAATRTGASTVALSWATVAELDSAGFHVWRGTRLERGERLGGGLIPSQGSASTGASYALVDDAAPSDEAAYWLEEIGLDGSSTFYGPAAVEPAGASAVDGWTLY